MKFMKLSTGSFHNVILNDHSCKILFFQFALYNYYGFFYLNTILLAALGIKPDYTTNIYVRLYFLQLVEFTAKFYVEVSQIGYISTTTHQKAFMFGP